MREPDPLTEALGHREHLLRTAARLLGSREAAEDVVQEALLRYVERAGPAPDDPRAWLARVTRNLAVDRWRRARLERALLRSDAGGAADAERHEVPAPDRELERRERCREAIRRLLDGAGPRDVATVLLREVFGTDYADIARAGGRSPAACRQAVHRTLERARDRADRGARHGAGAPADAVLDRFAHAVFDADPSPLFDALRVAASGTAAGPETDRSPAPTARTRIELDAAGARISLVLDGVTLCTLGRPPPRAAASIRTAEASMPDARGRRLLDAPEVS